jgi:tRNA A-37 threonylcarbamoyl transferase component Bud32/DNA-directed RNA polymerase subunit RPC12/RpoP
MFHFICTACQKKLFVKDELAGKKVKCPGCGQRLTIPAQVVVPPREWMRNLPPSLRAESAGQDQGTQPPQLDGANAQTHPPLSRPDAAQDARKPNAGRDARLTDFLAPPQADDELGRLGKYLILTILGHGGMGVVFKAKDPKLNRSVAIKAMRPTLAGSVSAGKRFLREAQAMAAVEHDHIVRIYQVDEERGVPFLAMEFLKGETLDDRLKRDGELSAPEAVRVGREIAEALAAAHATGLIHRDVKPANVWLESPRNRVKILDFGLARAASQEAGLAQEGAIISTPAYTAPEERPWTPAATCSASASSSIDYVPASNHSRERTQCPRSWRFP